MSSLRNKQAVAHYRAQAKADHDPWATDREQRGLLKKGYVPGCSHMFPLGEDVAGQAACIAAQIAQLARIAAEEQAK